MKKLKSIAWLVLVVLTCAGFVACDEEEDDDYAEMIIGTWSYTGEISDDPYDYNYGYTFYSNGRYVSFGSGSWTGSYEVVDDMLIFNDDYEDARGIKSLTKNKLVLEDGDYGDEVFYRVN